VVSAVESCTQAEARVAEGTIAAPDDRDLADWVLGEDLSVEKGGHAMTTRRRSVRLIPARQRRRPAAVQLPAARVGAAAAGALAVGAGAVGALAIGRLVIGRAVIRRLQIEDLEVRRLQVHELRVDQQPTTPGPRP
jgi:hypothetical protein